MTPEGWTPVVDVNAARRHSPASARYCPYARPPRRPSGRAASSVANRSWVGASTEAPGAMFSPLGWPSFGPLPSRSTRRRPSAPLDCSLAQIAQITDLLSPGAIVGLGVTCLGGRSWHGHAPQFGECLRDSVAPWWPRAGGGLPATGLWRVACPSFCRRRALSCCGARHGLGAAPRTFMNSARCTAQVAQVRSSDGRCSSTPLANKSACLTVQGLTTGTSCQEGGCFAAVCAVR